MKENTERNSSLIQLFLDPTVNLDFFMFYIRRLIASFRFAEEKMYGFH